MAVGSALIRQQMLRHAENNYTFVPDKQRSSAFFNHFLQKKFLSMKFDLIRSGISAGSSSSSASTYKNVNVNFDGKIFRMREVTLLKVSGAQIVISFKWDNVSFVDYNLVKGGKFGNISATLGNRTIKIKNAVTQHNTMYFVIMEGWAA